MNKASDINKIVILYARLSREDEEMQGESNSITNQRSLLGDFAERNNLVPYETITDDGYSGTGWERPGWQMLLDLVSNDKVSVIVLKDLSRMGRDYLRVGLFMEMFRERGVRLIAINDNIDTENGEDDFTPFRTVLAEWYARDISRKIKSVLHNKGREGKPLSSNPIYGFRKEQGNKDAWVVDDVAASVVRRIFRMTIEGFGPFHIAKTLSEEKVERPSYHQYKAGIHATSGKCNLDMPYNWRGGTVAKILQQREYCGDVVNFKYVKPSFKSKKVVRNTHDNMMIFKGALPAIISRETWELAQKLRKTKRIPAEHLPPNPLTGILFCGDCKGKMTNRRRTSATNENESHELSSDTYECSTYRNNKKRQINKCRVNRVSTFVVRELILQAIRDVQCDCGSTETGLAEPVKRALLARQNEATVAIERLIEKNKRRIAEIDMLFRRIYEDIANERLSENRYELLAAAYENEQADLIKQNEIYCANLDVVASEIQEEAVVEDIIKRYSEINVLTPSMINELIDKVFIYNADNTGGERVQRIDVYFNFIMQTPSGDSQRSK